MYKKGVSDCKTPCLPLAFCTLSTREHVRSPCVASTPTFTAYLHIAFCYLALSNYFNA